MNLDPEAVETLIVAGAATAVVGIALAIWSAGFARFQRDRVSKVLPERYWVFFSDSDRVRSLGIIAALVGVVVVGLAIASALRSA